MTFNHQEKIHARSSKKEPDNALLQWCPCHPHNLHHAIVPSKSVIHLEGPVTRTRSLDLILQAWPGDPRASKSLLEEPVVGPRHLLAACFDGVSLWTAFFFCTASTPLLLRPGSSQPASQAPPKQKRRPTRSNAEGHTPRSIPFFCLSPCAIFAVGHKLDHVTNNERKREDRQFHPKRVPNFSCNMHRS